VIASLVASYQVADALKILSGKPELVEPRITSVEIWQGGARQITAPPRDPDCPCCGRREFLYLEESHRAPITLCGRNAVQIHERPRTIDLRELKARLEPLGEVRANEFAVRFQASPYEMTIFPDGRAIIKGTSDPGLARSLYARYIGQ
jgi:adenylyltransferase/sulfurtransferase